MTDADIVFPFKVQIAKIATLDARFLASGRDSESNGSDANSLHVPRLSLP